MEVEAVHPVSVLRSEEDQLARNVETPLVNRTSLDKLQAQSRDTLCVTICCKRENGIKHWWQNASTSLDWNSSKFEAGTLFTLVPDLLVGAGNRHRYAG